jgi:hypothetical protein
MNIFLSDILDTYNSFKVFKNRKINFTPLEMRNNIINTFTKFILPAMFA